MTGDLYITFGEYIEIYKISSVVFSVFFVLFNQNIT